MKAANYNLELNKGWMFHLGDVNRFKYTHDGVYGSSKAGGSLGSRRVFLNKNYWQPVRVPHDWMTSLPVDPAQIFDHGYKQRGLGWYYIRFTLPNQPIQNARLVFEGVLGQTVVYVNGTIAARNFSGYNRFTCEISSYLSAGQENMIALSVDTTVWEAWSYEGAGLYRPVYIEFREDIRLDTYDCFVRGQESDGSWSVVADIRVKGVAERADDVMAISRLHAPDGAVIAETEMPVDKQFTVTVPVANARMWSPENPTLYKFTCELRRGTELLDALHTSVGLRGIVWSGDTGMYLNGEIYTVKGICCHQDHGGVGAAVTPQLMEYRISRLKQFGINAYRCAHHAVPDSLLDVCDRLGMLVMVENRHFSVSDDTLRQLESLVRLSRNHPCVFLYSLFNEEPWQADERGYLIARRMRELVLSLDSTRAVTGAMNGGISAASNASNALDVVGVNYHNEEYREYHDLAPEKAILGTENCPTFATRGVYVTDEDAQVFNSYGDHWADFTVSLAQTIKSVEENAFCAGCFPWSGFDSYGEPNPYEYPSVMSHWGFLDICGFAKDTAYWLAAWYKSELFVHLFPHWNWNDGEEVRVCAFTNADTAELFVNGRSVGKRDVVDKRAEWKVPFEVGYIMVSVKRGTEQVSEEVRTAGSPARLVLEDITPHSENDHIRIINISVTDKEGTLIPDFDKTVYFDTHGIEILGVANGNPNGTQPNVAPEIALFHGRAQIIVTSDSLKVKAHCDGLPEANI